MSDKIKYPNYLIERFLSRSGLGYALVRNIKAKVLPKDPPTESPEEPLPVEANLVTDYYMISSLHDGKFKEFTFAGHSLFNKSFIEIANYLSIQPNLINSGIGFVANERSLTISIADGGVDVGMFSFRNEDNIRYRKIPLIDWDEGKGIIYNNAIFEKRVEEAPPIEYPNPKTLTSDAFTIVTNSAIFNEFVFGDLNLKTKSPSEIAAAINASKYVVNNGISATEENGNLVISVIENSEETIGEFKFSTTSTVEVKETSTTTTTLDKAYYSPFKMHRVVAAPPEQPTLPVITELGNLVTAEFKIKGADSFLEFIFAGIEYRSQTAANIAIGINSRNNNGIVAEYDADEKLIVLKSNLDQDKSLGRFRVSSYDNFEYMEQKESTWANATTKGIHYGSLTLTPSAPVNVPAEITVDRLITPNYYINSNGENFSKFKLGTDNAINQYNQDTGALYFTATPNQNAEQIAIELETWLRDTNNRFLNKNAIKVDGNGQGISLYVDAGQTVPNLKLEWVTDKQDGVTTHEVPGADAKIYRDVTYREFWLHKDATGGESFTNTRYEIKLDDAMFTSFSIPSMNINLVNVDGETASTQLRAYDLSASGVEVGFINGIFYLEAANGLSWSVNQPMPGLTWTTNMPVSHDVIIPNDGLVQVVKKPNVTTVTYKQFTLYRDATEPEYGDGDIHEGSGDVVANDPKVIARATTVGSLVIRSKYGPNYPPYFVETYFNEDTPIYQQNADELASTINNQNYGRDHKLRAEYIVDENNHAVLKLTGTTAKPEAFKLEMLGYTHSEWIVEEYDKGSITPRKTHEILGGFRFDKLKLVGDPVTEPTQ